MLEELSKKHNFDLVNDEETISIINSEKYRYKIKLIFLGQGEFSRLEMYTIADPNDEIIQLYRMVRDEHEQRNCHYFNVSFDNIIRQLLY